jgi:hypothetical protein
MFPFRAGHMCGLGVCRAPLLRGFSFMHELLAFVEILSGDAKLFLGA